MSYHDLHLWLLKSNAKSPDAAEITRLQVDHIRALMEIQKDPFEVWMSMLYGAIELAHVSGGKDELSFMADHLRDTADSIEVRIRRGSLRTVSTVSKPSNQE